MEPPKIIRDADPQEGRGCWLGCFGIGCLIMVVGFFGLLVGGWYGVMHTRLPLIMIEQAIEEDGKVKIEGLTGSVSKGIHIDQIKFLTIDEEHWSELRGIKFDYNGFLEMSRTGRFVVERMSVESGTIYADVEGPDDFLFSPGDLNAIDDFKDSDLSELRIDLLEVNDLKIVNLDTDYSIEIETASLQDFVVKGEDGMVDLGQLTVKSNVLEVSTAPSTRWPDSPTAKNVHGRLRSRFSDRMKKDVDFAIDLGFDNESGRQAIALFQNSWVQEFSRKNRSIHLTDFSPEDYFKTDLLLPNQIQLSAVREQSKVEFTEKVEGDSARPNDPWVIAPGASFQLGATTFQIASVDGNRSPLRSIIGTATVNGETVTAELRSRDYFQKCRIDLKVNQQLADKTDWAQIVFGSDFESLRREDQRTLEATIAASKSLAESNDPSAEEGRDEENKAEADEPIKPIDPVPPPDANPPSNERDSGSREEPKAPLRIDDWKTSRTSALKKYDWVPLLARPAVFCSAE